MKIKISVIVPAYNIAQFLDRCLRSVLAQTHRNLEVIVVDDGSTDGTGALADHYAKADSRVRVIHKENGGVTSARLRGVAEATGDWIGFVDGDDWIEPEMYEHLLGNALAHSAQISHCGYQMVFSDGHVDFYYNTGRTVLQQGAEGLRDLIRGEFVEPGLCNKLYDRTLFQGRMEHPALREDIRINEDLLMNYLLFRNVNRAVYEDICPYHYILRKGSAANSKLNEHKLRDPLRVARLILRDVPEEAYALAYEKLVRILVSGASMDLREAPELVKPYRKQARKELRKNLGQILFGGQCGAKLKLQAFWAGLWPTGYGWTHRIYLRLTGLDKIYRLE